MIDLVRFFFMVIVLSLVASGCKEEKASPNPPPVTELWKLGGFTYVRESSSQTKIPATPDLYVVTAVSWVSTEQGGASGSTVNLKFYDAGEGDYEIVDGDTFVDEGAANAYITLDCTIGTGVATGASLYGPSAIGGTATVTKEDSRYYITIKTPVMLTRLQDFNGGVDGVENEYAFTGNLIN